MRGDAVLRAAARGSSSCPPPECRDHEGPGDSHMRIVETFWRFPPAEGNIRHPASVGHMRTVHHQCRRAKVVTSRTVEGFSVPHIPPTPGGTVPTTAMTRARAINRGLVNLGPNGALARKDRAQCYGGHDTPQKGCICE